MEILTWNHKIIRIRQEYLIYNYAKIPKQITAQKWKYNVQ